MPKIMLNYFEIQISQTAKIDFLLFPHIGSISSVRRQMTTTLHDSVPIIKDRANQIVKLTSSWNSSSVW
jgi:hypothetical protein